MRPYIFYRIEFRGIGRKEFQMQALGNGEKFLNIFGAMRLKAIPYNDKIARQLFQEASNEGCRQHRVYIGIRMQAEVQTETGFGWSDTKGGYYRYFLMRTGFLIQDRGLSFGTPCPSDKRRHEKTAFINKDDMGFQTDCFFLMRGQSTLIHRFISSSLRSMARRSGFCGLQPSVCRSLPI